MMKVIFLKNPSKKMAGHEREEYGIYKYNKLKKIIKNNK